ncbi:hypothetical protein SELMODRAFT_428092 [Selaginella moellendorffii]|uniref:Uncharacterized protein n=1 Tax=Selaginella moellendorffii TaxID=88036 RepID=D8T1Q1_SELML|nr:hypothetical protein SELMODRAFT_428092 [Selaginella moellendorffii]
MTKREEQRELSLDPDICVVYLDKVTVEQEQVLGYALRPYSWQMSRLGLQEKNVQIKASASSDCLDNFFSTLEGKDYDDYNFNGVLQAQADLQGVQIMITSVIELTGGHKGIVGSCLDYLELWTSRQWIEATDSFHLSPYMVMLELRNLIAQGVLIAQEAKPDGYDVRISSPMLQSFFAKMCYHKRFGGPPSTGVDPLWVVFQAIRTLDAQAVCRPECIKRTGELSEYSYQLTLFTRIKAVLKQAYLLVDAKLLPDAKSCGVS